jgi:hypothetical protein
MGRYASRNTTEYHRSLDIRELNRWGLPEVGGWRTITWREDGEAVASIGVLPCFDHLVLRYSHESLNGEREHKEYPVFYTSTLCHYGGVRRWFICPARGCSRRVAVLYSGSIFACRHCLDLSYESQREAPYSRALRRARKIHTKLGGTGCTGDELPDKPRWMHWKTYSKLIQEYNQALDCSWPPFLFRGLD